MLDFIEKILKIKLIENFLKLLIMLYKRKLKEFLRKL